MDKEQYEAIKAAMRPYFRAGISRANVLEAVQAAYLDVEEEQKLGLADLAVEHKALGSMEVADKAGGTARGVHTT